MPEGDTRLLKAFREAVVAKIRRDLAEEDKHAESLRDATLPCLRKSIVEARASGACGRAWLFGSFAWGKPTDRSDVDLLVEGCARPFRLAAVVGAACDRDAHVVELERAPDALRDRVLAEGIPL